MVSRASILEPRTKFPLLEIDSISEMVFKTVIHRNVKLGEATSFGKSIIDYDVSSKGADNYLNLAKELISKN